jgi:hypothetical protein
LDPLAGESGQPFLMGIDIDNASTTSSNPDSKSAQKSWRKLAVPLT